VAVETAIVLIELWSAGREPVSTRARERRHQTPPWQRHHLAPKSLPTGTISADSPADYSGALLGRLIDLCLRPSHGLSIIGN